MHARHRSPGNGYRSSSVGMGSVAAPARITSESSIRGHGMFNSEYRGYSRGFGRGQPTRPTQIAQPPPPQRSRSDMFMEAGRLATDYLVSKGVLAPNVINGKWQNGSLRNHLGGDFQGFRQQEGESLHLPPDGGTSAISRMGNAADVGSGSRRRLSDDFNPNGSKSYSRDNRRMGSFKNYSSERGREMGRSSSWSEKSRLSPDRESNDNSRARYQEVERVDMEAGNGGQSSHPSELVSASDGSGESQSGLDNAHLQDDRATKASSTSTGIDLPTETDVEFSKTSDDIKLLDEESVELKDGSNCGKVEKQCVIEDVPMQRCAAEGDSINKNENNLLSLFRFSKVPTKIRSSLTTRGPKVDPLPITEEEKDLDVTHEGNSCVTGPPAGSEVTFKDVPVDGSSVNASNQIQGSKCFAPDILQQASVNSPKNAEEVDPVNDEKAKCTRSQSFPHSTSINEQKSKEDPSGFGRCSSMIMERGEKRTAERIDIKEETKKPREWFPAGKTQTDEYLHLTQSTLTPEQPNSEEGRRSPMGEMVSTMGQERPMDIDLFQKDGAGPCIEYTEEKQLFPSSFKICDLNLMEASQVNENSVPDPILLLPSIPESKREATPGVIDLSMSNNCDVSGRYDRRGADGKEVEVIDLENDPLQDDNVFNNSERKEDAVFMGSESFPNNAQSANNIPDVQGGYGLMISDFLGNDISNCSGVPADINSLQNEMALHNGEGILGDDESIYMSLGEIPISFLGVWEQSTEEYDNNKPF